MPKYTIQVPDGRTVTAEAPDEATAMRGIQEWYRSNPKAEEPTPNEPELSIGETAVDTLIGTGAGITKAATGLGELPADVASGARWLADKAGVPQSTINTAASIVKNTPMVGPLITGSQALRSELDDPTTRVGRDLKAYQEYQPESTVGKYGKTTGEFAAGLLGPKTGMLTRALKYTVAPGLASEGLGQLTEGTQAEPIARAAGGLLGMGGAALLRNRGGERAAKAALETQKQFEDLGRQAYEEVKSANVMLKENTLQNLKSGLSQHLDDIGFLPGSEQKASAVLDDVYKNLEGTTSRVLAGRGAQTGFGQKPISLWELDKVSKKIADKIKDYAPKGPLDQDIYSPDRRILWAAKHYIDDFAQQLGQRDILAGDLPRGLEALRKAKLNWKIKSKLGLLDQIEDQAHRTGKSVFTRGGEEHATRREFLKFLRKPEGKRQQLTKQETEAFDKVASGSLWRNALRGIGKFGANPSSMLYSGSAAGAGGFLFGGPAGAAIGFLPPAAGLVSRLASNAATRRAVNDARSIIINGRKLPRYYKSKYGTAITLDKIFNDYEN